MTTNLSPMYATWTEICAMPFDNVQVGDFSIMTDGVTVWLSEHHPGSEQAQCFALRREVFNKLILWYTQNVVPEEDKRKPNAEGETK